MSICQTIAQFFRNAADYIEPKPTGIHPSEVDKELRRRSYSNFTGRNWTQAERQQDDRRRAVVEISEFEEICKKLKGGCF